MAKQELLDNVYMRTAELHASLSNGIRAKVGCAIVTESGVVLTGYNGTPAGLDNSLEYVDNSTGELLTKPGVIHAELNAVLKAAKEGVSVNGATVYVTHSPCEHCAGMLVNAGVKSVLYRQVYKSDAGVQVLKSAGIFTKLLER